MITTNWDPLAERVLAEDGRWNPIDGYGFERRLRLHHPTHGALPLPAKCAAPSDIKVLKLHGCFGWRETGSVFFLEGPEFLDVLGIRCGQRMEPVHDANEPTTYQPSDAILAYPSYLKKLTHPALASVWQKASAAILSAKTVKVVGYSLPESDSAIRALLLPLRERLDNGAASAEIIDKSQGTLNRWKDLLGPNAKLRLAGIAA